MESHSICSFVLAFSAQHINCVAHLCCWHVTVTWSFSWLSSAPLCGHRQFLFSFSWWWIFIWVVSSLGLVPHPQIKFLCWSLSLTVMALGSGPLGGWFGQEGGALGNGISAFIFFKGCGELLAFHHERHREQMVIYEPERGSQQTANLLAPGPF